MLLITDTPLVAEGVRKKYGTIKDKIWNKLFQCFRLYCKLCKLQRDHYLFDVTDARFQTIQENYIISNVYAP